MPGMTNKLKAELLDVFFRGEPGPIKFYLALVTSSPSPGPTTNILSDLTELPTGSGYTTGGVEFSRDDTDFPNLIENDTNNKGIVELKDIIFTATGPFPASGPGAHYAVLTDDASPIGNRKVYLWFDLQSDRSLVDTQSLQINDMNAELLES